MKRTVIIPLSTLLLGIVIGVGGSYFSVMRLQTLAIRNHSEGALCQHVIAAARLRAGQQDKALADFDKLILMDIPCVKPHLGAKNDGLARIGLGMAKAYYTYSGLPIPASVQPSLADIEPLQKNEFESVRDTALQVVRPNH